jgi:Na+-transporting methylmalonyl-CoA/oxaloacetate decarboxylase beta subunit
MQTVNDKLHLLREKNAHVNLGGGVERLEAQHKLGKMTAHERLHLLYDNGFYDELFGSAGVSAVPMAARVSHNVGQEYNPQNYLLMHAMGPNVAGVIGTAIAAGVLLAILG